MASQGNKKLCFKIYPEYYPKAAHLYDEPNMKLLNSLAEKNIVSKIHDAPLRVNPHNKSERIRIVVYDFIEGVSVKDYIFSNGGAASIKHIRDMFMKLLTNCTEIGVMPRIKRYLDDYIITKNIEGETQLTVCDPNCIQDYRYADRASCMGRLQNIIPKVLDEHIDMVLELREPKEAQTEKPKESTEYLWTQKVTSKNKASVVCGNCQR